jgi:hypothetical protein
MVYLCDEFAFRTTVGDARVGFGDQDNAPKR